MLSTDLSEHALLDALPVSVYSLDLDGHLTSVRRASTRFSEDAVPLTVITGDGSRGTPIWDAMRDTMSRDQIEYGMQLLRTGRAPVVHGAHDGVGPEVTAAHAPRVERHEVRPVRVDAPQVGLEQVVGDGRRLRVGRSEPAEQQLQLSTQRVGGDDQASNSRSSSRIALPRTMSNTVSSSRCPNSCLATWCVLGQVLSWCG